MYRAEIRAFLAYFCLNLVAMATPFALLKMLIAYLYPPTTKTLPYTQKVSRYLVDISTILAYFGLHLVAMATALAPLKIQIAHLKFADLKNPTAHEKMC